MDRPCFCCCDLGAIARFSCCDLEAMGSNLENSLPFCRGKTAYFIAPQYHAMAGTSCTGSPF